MPDWELIYYTTGRGDSPVQTYIDALPAQDAAHIYEALDLLAEFGIRLGRPHVRALQGSDLWELRVRARGNQHRIFYVAIHGRQMLLLHAFQKKSQGTPRREIRTAEQRLRDFLNRNQPVGRAMMRHEDAVRERMERDPEFRRIWEERRPQFAIRRALIAARLEAGMTQEELAEAAGIPRSTVTRLEAGEGNPTVSTLQKLAGALNMRFMIDGEGLHPGRELAHAD